MPATVEPPAPYEELALPRFIAAVMPTPDRALERDAFDAQARASGISEADGAADAFLSALYETLSGGDRRSEGMTQQEMVAQYRGWVSTAIEKVAEAVAQVRLGVYRSARDGSDPLEIIDFNHPLVRLLERPNPLDTRFDFWQRTITSLELTGNAIWLKVRAGTTKGGLGQVVELWPLPTQYMKPVYKDGALYGYGLTGGIGGEVIIPPWDVVHHQLIDPSNRFWGKGRIARMIDYVKSNNAILASQLVAFNNDLMATLAFECQSRLNDPQWKRLMASIMSRYAGFTKAGKPLLLENGITVKNLQPLPKEMAYRDSSDMMRVAITAGFGVPPIIFGITDSANYSTTASQEHVFEKYSIKPRVIKLQERINCDLTPEFADTTLFVAFDDPVSEDALELARLEQIELNNGTTYPDECRAARNKPPVPWGYGPRWWVELKERERQFAEFGIPIAAGTGGDGGPNDEQADDGEGDDVRPDPKDSRPSDQGGDDNADDDNSSSRGRRSLVRVKGPSLGRQAGRRLPPARRFNASTSAVRSPSTSPPWERRQVVTAARLTERTNRLLRGIAKSTAREYERLRKATVPSLRRYFERQRDRVVENVRRMYEGRLEDAARGIVSERREIFCVTARSTLHARLFGDGTTVDEMGREGIGLLGKFVDVPNCFYNDGERSIIVVRGLPADEAEGLDAWLEAADRLAESMGPKLREAMGSGGEAQYDYLDTGDAFSLDSPRAVEWLRNKERDYWNGTVNETTKQLLSEKLAMVMNDAPTLDKLIDVVNEVMAGRIASSAETIARTEVVGAYNAGGDIVRKEEGIELKRWLATFDDRTRDGHADADGQEVNQHDSFFVEGEYLEYPGDPNGSVSNIVNCRCTAVAVIE